jgi:glycosyltransferase involved in cell wall biosynthesis
MRIGIDARLYSRTGPGRYIRNLIKIDTENEYFIFLLDEDLKAFKKSKNFQPVSANFKWYGFEEQRKFPPLLNKYKLDLVHFPHLNIPVFYSGKFVVTIHDLIHYDFKMFEATTRNPLVYELKHHVLKQVVKRALIKSQKIITVSHFVENELVTRLNVERKKIIVTFEAADDNFINLVKKTSSSDSKKILEKYGAKPPYLMYVGNAHPHKNIEMLIRAFGLLRERYQYLQLVLVGNPSPFWQKIRRQYPQKNILYLENLTDQELVALYRNAQAYVFPSLSEGFGLPLLEAMVCGCPVVSSNKTSLPEVGGDGAVYFDPTNIDDMVEKIQKVLNDQKLRKDLITKGEKRYKQFSWQKLAEQTLGVYKQSLDFSSAKR